MARTKTARTKKVKGKYIEVVCPGFGSAIAEVDTLLGMAKVKGINPDGSIDWDGETDVDWDSQKHAGSVPLFTCTHCDLVWDCIQPFHEVGKSSHFTAAMTEHDMTWYCPGCHRTAVVGYDDLAVSGTPMCSDCDLEMERLALPDKA